ncbi:putative E3 ubiquitin-protein ligase TRIML2 [Tamandua tetradactyla]|uniref:putative E3 ubiquitin-protein ligase TRIML2 n=1 Tax=Tamandua tetradactyla TaxID=48850 RepID=UPI0040545B9D
MSKSPSPQFLQKIPDYYCVKHLEPPQLFCDDDQITLCVKCFLSQEHKYHMMHGIEEASVNYRKLFQEILNTLRKKLEVAKSILADVQGKMVMIQREEHNFKEMIKSEYRLRFRLLKENNEMNLLRLQGCVFNLNTREANLHHLIKFARELEEKYQETLQRVNSLGRENMNTLKKSEDRVSTQINSLQSLIRELEKNCGESTLALLQNVRLSLERSESPLLQCLEPAYITNLSFGQITGMSEMLRVFQRHITLDSETAHPLLVLSDDLSSVRFGNVLQGVPDDPKRFDFSATVLGVESFSSGRHYWEVNVEKATKWQLGICKESASQKGDRLKASRDKFLLTGSIMGSDFTLWVFPPLKRVSLREQMHKVGVFLDYEYGQISFYNVTERALIYNFSYPTFQGALRPIFSLCIPNEITNSDCLTICTPQTLSCGVAVNAQSSLV